MVKFFHELTRDEFNKLCETGISWGECAKEYPQPEWCSYPNAIQGVMGCWYLMEFKVRGRPSCRGCAYYIEKSKARPSK